MFPVVFKIVRKCPFHIHVVNRSAPLLANAAAKPNKTLRAKGECFAHTGPLVSRPGQWKGIVF